MFQTHARIHDQSEAENHETPSNGTATPRRLRAPASSRNPPHARGFNYGSSNLTPRRPLFLVHFPSSRRLISAQCAWKPRPSSAKSETRQFIAPSSPSSLGMACVDSNARNAAISLFALSPVLRRVHLEEVQVAGTLPGQLKPPCSTKMGGRWDVGGAVPGRARDVHFSLGLRRLSEMAARGRSSPCPTAHPLETPS